ncbi:hypothetical protein [Blastochloris tepida]|jgi:hypothetical protein|uniref:DUF2798 domain-containing protein n=1 Tax=Blastochloris tepida TaxID=2233851 RepID=A0A348G0P1_9HYPH|nr:hypothetical protein [Blastochloris tepida]BBF93124.1 hypothetical protein BLTE_18090 [Blastochloris tepida]
MTTTLAKPGLLGRARFLAIAMSGAYLFLNALMLLTSPLTAGWPMWGVTALNVPPMVLAMVHLVIPLARRVQSA